MSTQFHPKRQIICEVCGRQCQTRHGSRDICNTCHHKEPSALCISCGNMKHLVSKVTGLCPRCVDIAALPTGECARCSQVRVIHNQQARLCKTCDSIERKRIRDNNKSTKIECSVCGQMRVSALFGRAICTACYLEECNGQGICARCNRHATIYHKAQQYCKKCYNQTRKEGKRIAVECSVCGKLRVSALFQRNICTACYEKEFNNRGICARCNQHTVITYKKLQLCRQCYGQTRKRYKNRPPMVECSSCGQMRVSALFGRAICTACLKEEHNGRGTCVRCNQYRIIYHKAQQLCEKCQKQTSVKGKRVKVECSVCGKLRISALFQENICSACYKRENNSRGICARCNQRAAIYHKVQQLCKACYQQTRNEGKTAKVECSVCGKLRVSALFSRAICRACLTEERNGRGTCARCNQHTIIYHKAQQLCKLCCDKDWASQALYKYVTNFTSPYPYNTALFELLATKIDWNSVDGFRIRDFKAFGHFLQTYQLREPLTWEAIEEALPPWKRPNSRGYDAIRRCLLALGHLLVDKGKLESRETFKLRCSALAPMKYAPEPIQPVLTRYAAWLWERQNVPADVGNHLTVLTSFWSWCEQRGVRRPEEVHTALIYDYLMTLYWQWQCSVCQGILPFDPHSRQSPGACSHCGIIGSLRKVKRYGQETVRIHHGKLRVFFDWAVLNRMVISSPVRRKISAPKPTIEHYPRKVIQEICSYILASDAHPAEALILYLIIFHACSAWELRHAQLPTLYPLHKGVRLPTLAESYYILIPKPAPSHGDHSPGRPNIRVDFPTEAATWLKPLLERYERHRRQVVKNVNNRYLLFSYITATHNIPVGIKYVYKVVRQASLRILGKACTPKTLRKTVGTMFADRAGAAVLRFLGWHGQQAFAYSWAERKTVHPQ